MSILRGVLYHIAVGGAAAELRLMAKSSWLILAAMAFGAGALFLQACGALGLAAACGAGVIGGALALGVAGNLFVQRATVEGKAERIRMSAHKDTLSSAAARPCRYIGGALCLSFALAGGYASALLGASAFSRVSCDFSSLPDHVFKTKEFKAMTAPHTKKAERAVAEPAPHQSAALKEEPASPAPKTPKTL